jgi:methyl-accepting chemotaxis protein
MIRLKEKRMIERLRNRHLLAIFITGAVQSLTMLVVAIFSSNIEWAHFTRAVVPGFGLAVLVLVVHYAGPGMFLKELRGFLTAVERGAEESAAGPLARRAQGELQLLPGRLARWTAVWWVVCTAVLCASMAFLPGVIVYWWEIILLIVLAGLGGVFGYLFIFHASQQAVREIAGEVLALDTGFHVERQSEPIRGVGRKLMSSFLSLNLAGSLILLALFFFQAGAGERAQQLEVMRKVASGWKGGADFQPLRDAAALLGREFLVFSNRGELLFNSGDRALADAEAKMIAAKLNGDAVPPGQTISVRVDRAREYLLLPMAAGDGPPLLLGQVHSWSGSGGWKVEAFIVCLVIGILTGVLVTVVVRLSARDLLTPVAELLAGTRRVARGDISDPFTIVSDDEIGSLAAGMKGMVGNLRRTTEMVRSSSQKIEEVVGDLRQSSSQVAASSMAQRREIETTNRSMVQLGEANLNVSNQAGALGDAIGVGTSRISELTSLANETGAAMDDLHRAVDTSSSSILQMGASLKQVAENADNLMDRSEQTSAMVVELEASIREVETSSRDSKDISDGVIRHASEGVEAVQHTIAGIGQVRDSVGKAQETIEELVVSARQIGKILKVINDVTNRINLLALNAAIIAAQAGEHGRGFSVVADEIKSLADRTAASTAEIDLIIGSVQKGAAAAVTAMNEGHQSVEEGVNRSFVAGQALEKIQRSVEQSFAMVDRIPLATGQQAISARRAMEQIEAITELIRQIATATREQARAGDLIMSSTEHINAISSAVQNKAERQNVAAGAVSRVMGGLDQLVAAFNRSHETEKEVGAKVQTAMTRIRETAQSNEDSVKLLDQDIALLKSQADTLAAVISQFKTEREDDKINSHGNDQS